MNRSALLAQIRRKRSYLCIGLDPVLDRLPPHLLSTEDPFFSFNKAIIDATADLCVAYKPNVAFYEALGAQGWESLAKTIRYIPDNHLVIADAKRADIGNTSRLYASALLENLGADAITVAPYMGEDSVQPFLEYPDKWVILLALTSNKGSRDFQFTPQDGGLPLYAKVMQRAMEWAGPDQLMFVVGATHPGQFEEIRALAPDYFFLVPGVGAQGGDLRSICLNGFNREVGLLVNSSRGIIYAGKGTDFADKSRAEASRIQKQMEELLEARKLID
ncbi:MAG: orotidine-5'-phosphate decarboxylase [Saprospiraceae bacterium]|nr:orotidine-5'-phosphate decarboxylase [Saprospiraceae bacterium]